MQWTSCGFAETCALPDEAVEKALGDIELVRSGSPYAVTPGRLLKVDGASSTPMCLVKELHLPWWWGARHFMNHLIDGDIASNQHNWQWVAGCGTDAAPHFRIFSPEAQAKKFDPDGAYVEKYAPEHEVALDRYQAIRS